MTNNILQSFLSAIKRLQPFSTVEIFIGYLHITEILLITKQELKGKSGVYGFLCKTTGKLYIGSSINFSSRFNDHIKDSRSNVQLQRAIKKYKLGDFIFVVFEFCEPKDLISREQFYIDSLKPEFNILTSAGSSLGYKHTEETKAKLSESHNGKTVSEETKAKISESNKGISRNLGKTLSEETKALISTANEW